jgi:hypothetical protein
VSLCGTIGLEAQINLFAVHGYVTGCREAEADLVPFHPEHSDGHVVADLYGLTYTSAQNEHG